MFLGDLGVKNEVVLPMQPVQQTAALLQQRLLAKERWSYQFLCERVRSQSRSTLRVPYQTSPLLIVYKRKLVVFENEQIEILSDYFLLEVEDSLDILFALEVAEP